MRLWPVLRLLAALMLGIGPLVAAAQPAAPAPKKPPPPASAPPAVPGIYSTLKAIPEAGDILGMEVFIVSGGDAGHFAFIQCAEGWPGRPVLVAAKVDGQRVELAAHTAADSHCPQARFTGTVTRAGLQGAFDGQPAQLTLPRKKSFWQ
jgi:hypothetical protein